MVSDKLISVIIPVYNAERYLSATLDSILSQSYSNFEMILINDGSSDNSREIIEEYAARDSRIVVINKENQGVQYARRDGIAIAKGEYIKTMDNDDLMLPLALERLINKAIESDADMVVAPFNLRHWSEGEYPSLKPNFKETDGISYFKEICCKRAYWASWTTLHKRRLYIDNDIAIDSEIMSTEDTILTTQLAIYSKKIVSIEERTVIHIQREESLSHNRSLSDVRYRDMRKYPLWIEQFIKEQGLYEELEMYTTLLRVRNMFEAIHKRRLDETEADLRYTKQAIRKFPEITSYLHRRERKVIKAYQLFAPLGVINIKRYIKKDKL